MAEADPVTPTEKTVARAAKLVASKSFASVQPRRVKAYEDAPVPAKGKTSEEAFFRRAVNAAWLAHIAGKGNSAPAIVSEDPGLPLLRVRQLLPTARFKQAMEERGIPAPDVNYVTEEMIAALAVLRDTSLLLSDREKLNKLGISWSKFEGWLKYPPFRKHYRAAMEGALENAVERGDAKLAELIDQGNLRAIEYANEKTGKFVRGGQQIASMDYMMTMMLSIIQKHVTEEATLLALVSEFGRLAQSTNLSQPSLGELKPLQAASGDAAEYDEEVDEDPLT